MDGLLFDRTVWRMAGGFKASDNFNGSSECKSKQKTKGVQSEGFYAF